MQRTRAAAARPSGFGSAVSPSGAEMTQVEERSGAVSSQLTRKLVRSPQAIVRWVGDVLQITTPESDRNVETEGLAVLRVLGAFTRPLSPQEVLARFPKEQPAALLAVLEELLAAGVLQDFIDASSPRPAASGSEKTQLSPISIGQRCPFDLLPQKKVAGGLAILGAPCELGAAGEGGSRHGPQLIRSRFPAGSVFGGLGAESTPFAVRDPGALRPTQLLDIDGRRSFAAAELPVLDLGNAVLRIGESLADFGARLSEVLRAVLDAQMVPILLGGDHSLSFFPLALMAERHREFGILHFDAHTDLYDATEPEILTHANFLVSILKHGSVRRVHQIGLRGFQPVLAKQRLVDDPRISYVSAREVARLQPEQVFAGLPRDLPYYLTFDIDCMTPQQAPETGTRMIGGLDYYTALNLVDYAGRNFRIIGADFVEVALRPESGQWAAQTAAHLLLELMLSFMSPRSLRSHWLTGLGG